MIATFTHDDLVRYLYRETTEQEDRLIAHSLLTEQATQDSFDELLDLSAGLNHWKCTPSERAVQNILAFSRNYGNPTASDSRGLTALSLARPAWWIGLAHFFSSFADVFSARPWLDLRALFGPRS